MRRLVNMRLDVELLARVDEVCGPRGRTSFVEQALEKALGGRKAEDSQGLPASSRAPKTEIALEVREAIERRGSRLGKGVFTPRPKGKT